MLFVQNEDGKIVMAALVPLSAIIPIWTAQRDTSARLIESGRLGRRKKNHAMNGNSPTIWLQDDQDLEVAQDLRSYPGVLDLAPMPVSVAVTVLTDHDALDVPDYEFSDEDQRKVIERQIRERRGQQLFREALRYVHGDKCMATGCTVLAVLETAHIKPYRGEKDNHAQNGLYSGPIYIRFSISICLV